MLFLVRVFIVFRVLDVFGQPHERRDYSLVGQRARTEPVKFNRFPRCPDKKTNDAMRLGSIQRVLLFDVSTQCTRTGIADFFILGCVVSGTCTSIIYSVRYFIIEPNVGYPISGVHRIIGIAITDVLVVRSRAREPVYAHTHKTKCIRYTDNWFGHELFYQKVK